MTGTPHQNAVHAIRRLAHSPKRHPATRQALLAIADLAAGRTQPEQLFPTSGNCGPPDGVIHQHVERCHQAGLAEGRASSAAEVRELRRAAARYRDLIDDLAILCDVEWLRRRDRASNGDGPAWERRGSAAWEEAARNVRSRLEAHGYDGARLAEYRVNDYREGANRG